MPKTQAANAQELVAIKEIRDGVLALKNGGLRQVLMVNGLNFALRSEDEQNVITSAYQNFLNGLDFSLQVVVHSRKINIEKYLKRLEAYEPSEPSPLLRSQNAEYREFIRGFVEKNAIMEKTFFVVIPWNTAALPSAGSLSKFLPFLKPKPSAAAKNAASEEAEFARSREQLAERVSQVADGLSAIGLDSVILGTEELIELFYNFYNPETVEKEDLPIPENSQ